MLSRTPWLRGWVILTAVAVLGCALSGASRQALGAQASALPAAAPPPADPLPPFRWQRLHTTEGLMASLTVVPPAVVTQNQLVELRLGLRSTSVHPQTVTVQFYINRVEDSARVMLHERAVTLEPLATQLVSTAWAPAAFHGRTAILAVVQREGQRLAQPNWPLMIVPPFDHAHGRKYASAPFFSGVWLELGALGFFPPHTITEENVRHLVRGYHARGMQTVVIAYPEFGGCFYYPSALNLHWDDYSACSFTPHTYFYQCASPPKAMHPQLHAGDRCPFVATFDVIGTILDEAEKHGMHVILGLGRSGDTFFALALEDAAIAARDGVPTGIDPGLLNRRLFQITTVSQAIADELWAKYGGYRSLYGWFLSHETTCYDVSRQLYDPVATYVKHRTMPDRPVMVAPYAVRNCVQAAATIPTHIKDSAVDIFFYQDAVGSSTVNPAYHFDPQQRIQELGAQYEAIAQWHAGTGKHLWSSVEIWRASPTQDQRVAPSGLWDTEVAFQLYHEGPYAQAFVLNEGLFYFDNGVAALRIPDPGKRASAEALTRHYSTYAQSYIKAMQAP